MWPWRWRLASTLSLYWQKSDLAKDDLDYYRQDAAEVYDIPVVLLDARDRDEVGGLLAKWCQPGQTIAFLGSSGVGKSTLVNSLCGSLVSSTKSIREDDGKGRHTTSSRQLYFAQCAILVLYGLVLPLVPYGHQPCTIDR